MRAIPFDFDQPETDEHARPTCAAAWQVILRVLSSVAGIESGLRIVKIPNRTPCALSIVMVAEVLNRGFPDSQLRGRHPRGHQLR